MALWVKLYSGHTKYHNDHNDHTDHNDRQINRM
jgi:hypothetical protein